MDNSINDEPAVSVARVFIGTLRLYCILKISSLKEQSDQINYDFHHSKQHYTITIFRQPHIRLTPTLEVACKLMEAALDYVASMKGKSHSESAQVNWGYYSRISGWISLVTYSMYLFLSVKLNAITNASLARPAT